jgi:hypothetical protein
MTLVIDTGLRPVRCNILIAAGVATTPPTRGRIP